MARFHRIVKFLIVPLISIIVATDSVLLQSVGASYRGKYLGPLSQKKHSVSGHVYAVDSRTLHLQNFNYDGLGPDAFFWVGFTDSPGPQGIIVPNERGTKEVLTAYNNADITISLPDGLTLRDIKWFAVWCRAYEVNFGDVYIPPNFDFPQPHVIGSIVGQGISSGPIVVVDAQTILVPDFTYDGQAPDLHFWVGRGSPGPDGIRVPDETGADVALAKADKKTLVLSLPGELTIFDIDYFGVYSRLYNIDYGHVRIQPELNVPPSLRMLGISPQTRLNCEVLHDDMALEIRWSVVGSGETIVFQLVGRIDDGKYMAFGLSGENDRSVMLGGDVAVGWIDPSNNRGHVIDYYLERKAGCVGSTGSCPDVHWKEGTNNVRMLSAASVNGFTILTYQRKLGAADIYDKTILTNGSQPVIWAVGQVKDGLAQYHFLRNKDDLSIDFGRTPKWNCPEPEASEEAGEPAAATTPNVPSPASFLLQSTQTASAAAVAAAHNTDEANKARFTAPPPTLPSIAGTTTEKVQSGSQSTISPFTKDPESKTPTQSPASWAVPPIPCYEPDDRVYYAQLGPTGGTFGYRSITGRKDKPQEAWYINGLLLPEINLVRNYNYTFVIQGGDNPESPDDYNPFYITDDPEGGHEVKTLMERQGVKVFAGVDIDSHGNKIPTAVGKLCRWIENGNQSADFFTSYAAYQRSLFLNCDKGSSGILHFTPNKDTPDLLYYQSFTKKYLGWKIHIVDDCEVESESMIHNIQRQQQQSQPTKPNISPGIMPQQQQQPHQLSLGNVQHLQQQGVYHLSEQSRSPSDQRLGETVNHHSVVSPLLPIGDSKTILNNVPAVASITPMTGLGSSRPMESAYLFAASPTDIPGMSLAASVNGLKNSPFFPQQQTPPQFQLQHHHHQQQQQQRQLPSIISVDPNRILINAKPLDGNGGGVQVSPGIPQYAALQGHQLMSMSGQSTPFNFPHQNTAFFQVALDGGMSSGNKGTNTAGNLVSGGGGGLTENRIQTHGVFPPATFQFQGPLTEGHLIRRVGPQQHQPQLTSGGNRSPLLSQSIRYEGVPGHSIVYATTASPKLDNNNSNNPISYLAAQKHMMHPAHTQFPELATGIIPGQNPLVRFQDARLRSPAEISNSGSPIGSVVGKTLEEVKYLEMPTVHNIHMIPHSNNNVDGSRLGPLAMPAQISSLSWTQARNLPKREQKHPYFQFPSLNQQQLHHHFKNGNVRGRSNEGDLGGNDNNGFEAVAEKNSGNISTNNASSPIFSQSSAQRSRLPTKQVPLASKRISIEEKSKGSNSHAPLGEVLLLTSSNKTMTTEPAITTTTNSSLSKVSCSKNNSSDGNSCELHDPSNLDLSQQQKQQLQKPLFDVSATSKRNQEVSSTTPPVPVSTSTTLKSQTEQDVVIAEKFPSEDNRNVKRTSTVGETEAEGIGERAKDDHKAAGDGEEEGSSPDSLSLTLLTDIWQTINQDNDSKTPSQKPPAAVPPPKQSSPSATSGAIAGSSPPQRYSFQREHHYGHGNRQIPPPPPHPSRILFNGPPNGIRNRQILPILPALRRQPSVVPSSVRHPYGQRMFRRARAGFAK